MKLRTPPLVPAQAAPVQRTTVLIADDVPDLRALLRIQLARRPHLQIIGEAADGREALWLCADQRPDIAILDVLMPAMDGFEAARHIKSASPHTKVIIHSSLGDPAARDAANESGVDEYVVKGGGRDAILRALDRLAPAPSKPV